jgi:hypothetical protein
MATVYITCVWLNYVVLYLLCRLFPLYCLCGDIMDKHSIRTNSNVLLLFFFIYVENVETV